MAATARPGDAGRSQRRQLRIPDGEPIAGSPRTAITVRELLDMDIAEISLTAFPAYLQTDVADRAAVACSVAGAAAGPVDPLAADEAFCARVLGSLKR